MTTNLKRFAIASALACTVAAQAAETEAPASFKDAMTNGKVSLSSRVRYEHVDQDGQAEANALTVGINLGYTTKAYNGFQFGIEGESTTPLTKDYYDATGTNTKGYSVVADPEIYEINQVWASYSYETTKAIVGRQKIVLDNARFVGDVGWRQNQQTFDAIVLQDKTVDKLTLSYAYLDQINRIFDDSTAQYDWESNSHLFNASYAGCKYLTLTGYGYLLDFDDLTQGAFNNSSQTYGLSLAGSTPITDAIKATYRLEYATQSDYGSSTLSYDSDYYLAEFGVALKKSAFAVGYEVLGSDNGAAGTGFKTPLATLHAFNGWADKFLGTPNAGLTDFYLKGSTTLPGDVKLLAFYHQFGTTEAASDIGQEYDLQLSYKINKYISLTAKGAYYDADENAAVIAGSNKDTKKFTLQADFTY